MMANGGSPASSVSVPPWVGWIAGFIFVTTILLLLSAVAFPDIGIVLFVLCYIGVAIYGALAIGKKLETRGKLKLKDEGTAWLGGAGLTVVLYLVLLLHWNISVVIGSSLGFSITGPQNLLTGILAPNPRALLLIFALLEVCYGLYNLGMHSVEGAVKKPSTAYMAWRILLVLLMVMLFTSVVLVLFLQGDPGNLGAMFDGPAAEAAQETAETVTQFTGNAVSGVTNQLDPCNNPDMARAQCMVNYLGGGVFRAANGSFTVSKCVKELRKRKCVQSESNRVTSPIYMKVGDIRVEPFSNHYRVTVPVTNTLVTDTAGRPIEVPARNARVTVKFYIQTDEGPVAAATYSAGDNGFDLRNGERRVVEFGGEGPGGKPYFPIATAQSTLSNKDILQNLQALVDRCKDGPTPACKRPERRVFANRFRGQNLSAERVDYLIRASESISRKDLPPKNDKTPSGDAETWEDDMREYLPSPGSNILVAGQEYTARAKVEYGFSAEAAFTESSRWRSGNQLLKIWTRPAWRDLTLEERDRWRATNCHTVKKQGLTFQKQRTAALTTPVVPVMYADCAGPLFNMFGEEVRQNGAYTNTITIFASAVINDKLEDNIAPKGFKIKSATTNCGTPTNIMKNLPPPKAFNQLAQQTSGASASGYQGDWYPRNATKVLELDPVEVKREVTIEGQRKSIGCSLSMDIRVALQKQTVIGQKKEDSSSG